MKPGQKKYILENINKKSIKKISEELNLKERKIRKFLQKERGKKKQIGSKREIRDQVKPVSKLNICMSWKWHAVAMALIIVAGIAAYSNSIDGSFHFDDFRTITENLSVRDLNPCKVWVSNNHFRFVGFYSFALNYHFNGLDDVRGWHYVNISLHILCALFLYLILSFLMQDVSMNGNKVPLMASILFVVHPLCSEPVNYIQARLVLFYSLFSLSGLLCMVVFTRARSIAGKVISILGIAVSMALGGLSKEVGVFYVPAAIGVYLLIFSRKEKKGTSTSRLASVIGVAAVGVILIMITNWVVPLSRVFQPGRHPTTGEQITYITHLLTEAQVFWRYVSLLIPLSFRLNVDHYVRIAGVETLTQMLMAVISFLCIVGFLAFAFRQKEKNPLFAFLSLWALFGILPYLLVYSSDELMVEYKVYLSAMGFMGLIALCFNRTIIPFTRRRLPRYARMISIIVFSGLAIFCIKETRARNEIWKSEVTLWEDAVRKSPKKARPYYNLGAGYSSIGKYEEAIPSYRKAIGIKPDYAEAHNNLGDAYNAIGKRKEAMASCKKAIEIKPNCAKAYNNLGNAYSAIGKNEEAIASYRKAIEIDPDCAEAHNNLGNAYSAVGKREEAIALYRKAIEIKPDYAKAYNNLGNAYNAVGKNEEAVASYRKAIELGFTNPALLEALKSCRERGQLGQ